MIKELIYRQQTSEADTLFRIFLYRLFNRIGTWESLENKLDQVTLTNFSLARYAQALEEIKKENGVIYGYAFILCANKAFGFGQKHQNHLALLEKVFLKSKMAPSLLRAESLEELFDRLRSLPLIGDFMAYQLAIDFNYSEVFDFSENDFTVAGPGAVRGIKKCFQDPGDNRYREIINRMVEHQTEEFERLGLKFRDLWGRPLQSKDRSPIVVLKISAL